MALTKDEVDEFMAAQKLIRARKMEWLPRGNYGVFWTAPVEVDAIAAASLFLFVHTKRARHWLFKLSMEREELRRWDLTPVVKDHSNTGCPAEFPASVRAREHDHFWVEGLGCHCVKRLKGCDDTGHEETLEKFCARIRIEFEPVYVPPPYQQLHL